MTIRLDIQPELEASLCTESAKAGLDENAFILRAVQEHLGLSRRAKKPSHLPQDEARLLEQINQGLPEAVWQEYSHLVSLRRAETLSPEEHTRLIALSDQIEEAHLQRMTHLAELAKRRQIPIQTLMQQLGIRPREV